jgi:hypothetical protein
VLPKDTEGWNLSEDGPTPDKGWEHTFTQDEYRGDHSITLRQKAKMAETALLAGSGFTLTFSYMSGKPAGMKNGGAGLEPAHGRSSHWETKSLHLIANAYGGN